MEEITDQALDGGRVITQGVRFVRLGPDGPLAEETRDMADPNHCYLVRHPQGLLLWDCGLNDAIFHLPNHTLQHGRFQFEVTNPLADQLARLGVSPQEIRFLVFSHLQIDHAGNTNLFPNAQVLIQSAERDFAFQPDAAAWGYCIEDYACIGEADLPKDQQSRVTQLHGDADVFGDGRVRILSAPGHTPGHQVLYVEGSRGPLLFSGDLYYAPKDPSEGWTAAWNYHQATTYQTVQRLRAFAEQTGARWVINHSPAGCATGSARG